MRPPTRLSLHLLGGTAHTEARSEGRRQRQPPPNGTTRHTPPHRRDAGGPRTHTPGGGSPCSRQTPPSIYQVRRESANPDPASRRQATEIPARRKHRTPPSDPQTPHTRDPTHTPTSHTAQANPAHNQPPPTDPHERAPPTQRRPSPGRRHPRTPGRLLGSTHGPDRIHSPNMVAPAEAYHPPGSHPPPSSTTDNPRSSTAPQARTRAPDTIPRCICHRPPTPRE